MEIRLTLAAALVCVVSACAQASGVLGGQTEGDAQKVQEFLPDGGPPVVNGFYEAHGACPFEGCAAGDLYATGPVVLLERPWPDARVVATIPAGEWVSTANTILRMRPARGVVIGPVENLYPYGDDAQPILELGDVVYAIDYHGEGDTTLWRRGDVFGWMDTGSDGNGVGGGFQWSVATFEQQDATETAGGGWWLELVRANGERGWARELGDLDCVGVIDAAQRCNERWAASEQGSGSGPTVPDCEAYDISQPCKDLRSRAEPSAASYPAPRPFRDCAECPSMVRIPGRSFAVGQYEVTFAEWDACVAAAGCNGYSPDDQGWGRGNRPVMNVKWEDARAYVRWLSRHTRQRYRLLTTDEWAEAAFPGGRQQNYPWGNESPVCDLGARNGVAYDACVPQRTMPVGSFQPNAYGLYDTIGNVGEWLQDRYAPGDGRRAIIGSSWASNEESLGGRGGGWAHDLGPDTGFRVARRQ